MYKGQARSRRITQGADCLPLLRLVCSALLAVQVTTIDKTAATVSGCLALSQALSKSGGARFAAERLIPVLCPLLASPATPHEQFSAAIKCAQLLCLLKPESLCSKYCKPLLHSLCSNEAMHSLVVCRGPICMPDQTHLWLMGTFSIFSDVNAGSSRTVRGMLDELEKGRGGARTSDGSAASTPTHVTGQVRWKLQ